MRPPRGAHRGARAGRCRRSRRASRPGPAPRSGGRGIPNPSPCPGPPLGAEVAPRLRLPLAPAGPAPADKLTCGRRRPRPPSLPASERSPGAAAAAERLRTCSVPRRAEPTTGGTGERRESGGRAGCYQEDALKIGAAERNSWSLKGQRPPRSPQPRARDTSPAAGLSPRSRRRGSGSGACAAAGRLERLWKRGDAGDSCATAPASCPRPCGGSAAELSAAGLPPGGLWAAAQGRLPGSAPLHPSAGPGAYLGARSVSRAGPFTSGPGHTVKQQLQK